LTADLEAKSRVNWTSR